MAKGYGNLDKRFAKYFKRRNAQAVAAASRKAGPHEDKKRPALEALELEEAAEELEDGENNDKQE